MPYRPPKPCAKSGCPNVTRVRYCDDHQGEAAKVLRRYDDARGNATDRGYDARWKRTRTAALRRDNYLCLRCLSLDRVEPATEVHHTIPVSMAPERMHELDLLISVCHPCHGLLEEQIRRFGVEGVARYR